jgi:asparagine synthase (glutamine-hydrolysing)
MCGIAGAFAPSPDAADLAVRRITGAQVHRGPDDEGFARFGLPAGALAFGFRRLAIQDLSPAGHQPMVHPETGDTIVFNGEIYNFQALRSELEARGSRFRGRSDTEIILHAFARWGEAAFSRLHGMFALGIYRPAQRRLYLARDGLGIKPLYYGFGKGTFAFASELRALAASGLVDCDVDRRAVASFLAFGAAPSPLTLLKQAHLLEPGTWAELDLSETSFETRSLAPRRFWAFAHPERPVPSNREAVSEMGARLRDAVRTHLISDVPVGVFLSSGIDSTAIAMLASEIRGGDVDAFTVSMGGGDVLDEGPVAEETARRLGLRYHNISVREDEVTTLAERWFASIDQPTIDGLNTYIIARAVRDRGIVVALSGLGGDEIFGGYGTFREIPRLLKWARLARFVPARVREEAVNVLLRHAPDAQRRKGRELAAHTRRTIRSFYLRRRRLYSDEEIEALGFRANELNLDDDFMPPESEPDRWIDPDSFPFAALRILESRFYMGNMLLRDADVFGMAHGLEIRVPLLDHRVVDYALTLPDEAWVAPHRPNKPLLVNAVGRISESVVKRAKSGFALPQARWMAGPLRPLFEGALDHVRRSGLVDPPAVGRVWNDFLADRGGPTWSRPWALAVLGAWLDSSARALSAPVQRSAAYEVGGLMTTAPASPNAKAIVAPPAACPEGRMRLRTLAPTVTVVTPVLNGEKYIRETIESVLTQRGPAIEYIIVDGGSTDRTMEIVSEYRSGIAAVFSARDSGMYSAINKGFRHSSGEILSYLNSDDRYLPGTIEKIASVFSEGTVDLCFGNCVYVDKEGRELFRYLGVDLSFEAIKRLGRIPFAQQTTFWTRQLYDRVGGFDESYRYSADAKFLFECLRHTQARRRYIDGYLASFRLHSEALSSKATAAMNEEHKCLLRELDIKPGLSHLFMEAAIKWRNRRNLGARLLTKFRM